LKYFYKIPLFLPRIYTLVALPLQVDGNQQLIICYTILKRPVGDSDPLGALGARKLNYRVIFFSLKQEKAFNDGDI
jgi:hypothetical protein